MSYEVKWLREPRIVLINIWDELLLSEIRFGSKTVIELLEAGDEPVHVVVDVTRMTKHPLSVSAINQAGFFAHKRLGYLVVFGVRTPTVQIILTLLSVMSSFRLSIVDTMREALDYVGAHDATLESDLLTLDDGS